MDDQNDALKPVRLEVLGVPVDMVDMAATLDRVRWMLARPGAKMIVANNPEKVIAARRNEKLHEVLCGADLVIPDGIGVVLAARMAGQVSVARVPGSELMPAICELAAGERLGVFLYGARPQVVNQAAALLVERYPGLDIVGTQHGYLEEDRAPELLDRINASGAAILFVALGSPRQEYWMARHRHALRTVRVCQGVGGTFDAICGHPRRAPAVMRRMNLEWLYRLLSQPGRIHRQAALPIFAARVLGERLSRSLRGRRVGAP